MKILVTGAAGFIGYHTSLHLLGRGDEVIGVDNLNDYYDVSLKENRLAQLTPHGNFQFHKLDIADRRAIHALFQDIRVERVIHLAAQAGVRYSLDNPDAYIQSNLVGFTNILEACRHSGIEHIVYASSSSVYGGNTKIPFSIEDRVDQPLNLYGATKRANELIAFSYSQLFGMSTTGLRFFTVYGPWGRPDMSYFKFTGNIIRGLPVDVFNNGEHSRDFTYIDDIISGVIRALDYRPDGNRQDSKAGNYRLYNLGNNKPVGLLQYISILEEIIGRKAILNMLPKQPGDMSVTYADIDSAVTDLEYAPVTGIETGLRRFVDWYREYHGTGK